MTRTLPPARPESHAAYESVRDLVERTARRFARRFSYDEEDILGDAAVIFFNEAYPGFDPARSANFERRVLTIVWNRLYDNYRTWCRHRHNPRYGRVRNLRHEALARVAGRDGGDLGKNGYEAEDFYDVLGRDARAVVRLLLSPVPGLDETLRAVPSGVSRRRAVKLVLQTYLTDVRGWDRSRVRRAFAEIAEVTG